MLGVAIFGSPRGAFFLLLAFMLLLLAFMLLLLAFMLLLLAMLADYTCLVLVVFFQIAML
jgi:hypothetical protein